MTSVRPRHLLLLWVLLYAGLFRAVFLNRPFHYDPEGTGVFFGVLARNTLRHGWVETLGMPVLTMGAPGQGPLVFYGSHPPAVPWLIAASYSLFGTGEWQTRLPTALATLATVLALYRVVGRRTSPRVALSACALFAAMPMTLYYGGQPEVVWMPLLLFTLLALDAYLSFHSDPTRRRLTSVLAWLGLAGMSDWPAFLLVPVFAVHFLATRRLRRWGWLAGLVGGAALLFVAEYLFLTLATGSRWSWMVDRLLTRTGLGDGVASAWTGSEWLRMAWRYNLDRHTLPVLLLAAAWAATEGLRRRAAVPATTLARLLLAWGALHVAVGREGVLVHEWWWSPLTPGLALAAGLMLERLLFAASPGADPVLRRAPLREVLLAAGLAGFAVFQAGQVLGELRRGLPDRQPFAPWDLGQAIQLAAPGSDEVVLLAWSSFDPQVWFYADRSLKGDVWTVEDLARRRADGRVDLMFHFEQAWPVAPTAVVVPEAALPGAAQLVRHLEEEAAPVVLPPSLARQFRTYRLAAP